MPLDATKSSKLALYAAVLDAAARASREMLDAPWPTHITVEHAQVVHTYACLLPSSRLYSALPSCSALISNGFR